MARTSIIIVTYNSLRETTIPCLESVFSSDGDFEVIVVDNNSSDGTVAWLKELMAREPRLKCIFNEENRGFAGGNNDGIKIAEGEFIILLNSDCVVPRDWISGLIDPLIRDPGIGAIGPVTNTIGNEQKIFTSGQTVDEILNEGLAWAERSRGVLFETKRLIFFCVAMRREVFTRIGPLDEDFGKGFCEDDDYCIRLKKACYRLLCAEDVFVYHKGGGSFDGSDISTREILRKNEKKLKRKHGRPGCFIHPRIGHLQVIESYLENCDGQLNPDDLHRIAGRLRVIDSVMPRGWIKRLSFRIKLENLMRRLKQMGY